MLVSSDSRRRTAESYPDAWAIDTFRGVVRELSGNGEINDHDSNVLKLFEDSIGMLGQMRRKNGLTSAGLLDRTLRIAEAQTRLAALARRPRPRFDDPLLNGIHGAPIYREDLMQVTWVEAYACWFLRYDEGALPLGLVGADGQCEELVCSTAFAMSSHVLTHHVRYGEIDVAHFLYLGDNHRVTDIWVV